MEARQQLIIHDKRLTGGPGRPGGPGGPGGP